MTQLIRPNDVCALTGLSRTSIWRRVRTGKFPAPIELGGGSIAWREEEVEDWIAARPRVAYAPKAETAEAAT